MRLAETTPQDITMIKGLILLLFVCTPLFAGTIYKYTDGNGNTVYSDVAPEDSTPVKSIESKDLPPLLITQPEKVQRKPVYVNKNTKPVRQRNYQSEQCKAVTAQLEWIKKEIKRRTGSWTIEQLRDGKRKYTDLKHKHCI